MARTVSARFGSLLDGGRLLRGLPAVLATVVAAGLLSAPGSAVMASATPSKPAEAGAGLVSRSASGGVPVEITSLRTATSDTFQLPDGEFQAVAAAQPINYRDATGAWQPVDNRLVADASPGYALQNAANSYTVELPTDLATTPVKVTSGGLWLGFKLLGASGGETAASATATYANAWAGTAVRYGVGGAGVEETLVLGGRSAPTTFSFAMTASPGVSLAGQDGGIAVQLSGHTVGWLAPPTMQDAAASEGPVSLSITPSGAGWTVAVQASGTWLASAVRSFPVTIDPSVTLTPSAACWLDSFQPTIHECGSGSASVVASDINQGNMGTYYPRHGLVQFALPSSLPADAVVTAAHLQATVSSAFQSDTLALQRSTQSWDVNSTTWNQAQSAVNWSTAGGSVDTTSPQYLTGSYTSQTAVQGQTVDWYPTQLVSDWSVNRANVTPAAGVSNLGLLVRMSHETAPGGDFQLGSWTMAITYAYRWGIVSSLKFDSQRLNDRTSLSVQAANDNLVVRSNDLHVFGTGLDLTVNRIYNSLKKTGVTGWSFSVGADVNLAKQPDGSFIFSGPSGERMPFNQTGTAQLACTQHQTLSSSFFSPPGIGAQLCQNGTSYVLEKHSSGEQLTFGATANSVNGSTYYLSQDIDKNNNIITYNYNASHRLTSIVDTQGREFDVAYTSGNISQISGPQGQSAPIFRTWSYSWDSVTGRLNSYTDPAGNATSYGYDANANLSSITTPGTSAGTSVTNVSLSSGGVALSVSRNDASCPAGQCTSSYATTTTLSGSRCTQYAAPGQTASQPATMASCGTVTDANSHQTTYGFDQSDQAVKAIDGNGHVLESSYNSDSQVSTVSDAVSAAQVVFGYDSGASGGSVDRLDSVTSPTGAASTFTYTSGSTHPYQPDSTKDAQSNCSTFAYDNPSQVSNLTQSTAGLTSACGSQAGSATFTNSYEGDNSGAVTCGAAGHKGDLCSSTDGNGNTTSYHYDTNGNLTSATYPSPLGATAQTPDALSRLSSFTDAKSQKATYSYDTLDRITQILYNGTTSCTQASTCTTFAFDGDGNPTARSDATGSFTFSYNHVNQLTKKVMPFTTPTGCGSTTQDQETFGYDAVGNPNSFCDPGGTITYGYDAANELTSLAGPGSPTQCSGTLANCVTFGYDANHHRNLTNFPGGASEALTYDSSGRPLAVTTAGPGTGTFPTRSYCWGANNDCNAAQTADDRSLLQSVTDQAGVKTSYSYDAYNRLTSASDTAGHSYSYSFDPNGNRTQSTANGTTTNYAYNAANQLCWTSASTGTCASPPPARTAYTFNPNGSLNGVGSSNTFTYGPKNEMTEATIGSNTQNYTYADIDQTERTKAAGDSADSSPLGLMRSGSSYYTRDNNGVPIARRNGSTTKYYLADLTGNIIGMVDGSGNITNTYSYDPYGTVTASTGTDNELKFAGGFQDTITNFYHYGARYYDPGVGRWTQQDPIPGTLANTQTADRYTYAGGNPITNTDASGRDFGSFLTGIVVGGITTVLTTTVCVTLVVGVTEGIGAPAAYACGALGWAAGQSATYFVTG